MKEVNDSISGVTFAIYLNDGNDNYVEYEGDLFPSKSDGYKYNADISNCTDLDGNSSSNYTLYYNNDMVQVSTQESVYCYIYFDMYSYGGDWCLVNDITEYLGECALVMDDYSYTVEAAKENIEDKGEVTTSAIAPTITYGKSISINQTISKSTTNKFLLGKDYDFDSTTGMYTLKATTSPSVLTDDYIGYYTCSDNTSTSSCATMYKIISYTITDGSSSTTQKITSADIYTYVVNSTIDSENGIYMTYDDDGSTYYYRGSVKNNYVYFAGFYWRIIRINGDGSVRMIYAGATADATGTSAQIGKTTFNAIHTDPTYVGYKYGTLSETPIVQSTITNHTNFNTNTKYYFSTGYEEVGDGTFQLSSDGLVYGTFSELFGSGGDYEDTITDYYTCFSTSKTETCALLKWLYSYGGTASAKVYYLSYTSESYEDMLSNKNDSTIKLSVDKWYEENIKDKYDKDGQGTHLLSEYLADSIFCGDRSLYSGSGYLLTEYSYFNAWHRVNTSGPSLYCSDNAEDSYSVENGNLDYPIGLISVDEVMFAGGRLDAVNTLYYLYTGSTYWTMTPSYFSSTLGNAYVNTVNSNGEIKKPNWTSLSYGVRPVINLSSSVKISSGTGTSSNPFIVTLN